MVCRRTFLGLVQPGLDLLECFVLACHCVYVGLRWASVGNRMLDVQVGFRLRIALRGCHPTRHVGPTAMVWALFLVLSVFFDCHTDAHGFAGQSGLEGS